MHLVEILRIRMVPGAALFMALTRRCPLSCAHCSTESSLASEQYGEEPFRAVVDTFTAESHPQLLYMSGGEALLRAGLVRDLAVAARAAGTRSAVVSGMYFARDGQTMSPAVRRAIGSVDHFTASLDEWHEREVSRREVFRALHEVRAMVPSVSMQLVGRDHDDPYLLGLIADVRREFDDEVPMLVDLVGAAGRAREWLEEPRYGPPPAGADSVVEPCFMCSWPLVHWDGTVFACCSQTPVARARPAHLVLGHAARDPWSVLYERQRQRRMLHGIRVFGPMELRRRFGDGDTGDGYCGTCVRLGEDPGLTARVEEFFGSPAGQALTLVTRKLTETADVSKFPAIYGSPRHANLVRLGWKDATCAA
jgi:pyruvate-formate lyase-activating enzyme